MYAEREKRRESASQGWLEWGKISSLSVNRESYNAFLVGEGPFQELYFDRRLKMVDILVGREAQ